jgi:hypothetical protein
MAGLNLKMDAVMRFIEAATGIYLLFDPFLPRSPWREFWHLAVCTGAIEFLSPVLWGRLELASLVLANTQMNELVPWISTFYLRQSRSPSGR